MEQPESRLRGRTPVRSLTLIWGYVGVGIGLSIAILGIDYPWNWIRASVVILAAVNAGLAAQTALLYGSKTWWKMPEPIQQFGNSPSAFWLLALGFLLVAAGMVSAMASRDGLPPSTPVSLPLLALGFAILTVWSVSRLLAVRRLGELDG